jgi:hypothetical protein
VYRLLSTCLVKASLKAIKCKEGVDIDDELSVAIVRCSSLACSLLLAAGSFSSSCVSTKRRTKIKTERRN